MLMNLLLKLGAELARKQLQLGYSPIAGAALTRMLAMLSWNGGGFPGKCHLYDHPICNRDIAEIQVKCKTGHTEMINLII